MRPSATMILALLLAGCAVTSMDGNRMRPRSDAFSDYVETVFRRQNEVASELLLALDSEPVDSDRFIELEDADAELRSACRGLNEIALARRDGEPLSGLGALRRASQAPDCEREAERVAQLL